MGHYFVFVLLKQSIYSHTHMHTHKKDSDYVNRFSFELQPSES